MKDRKYIRPQVLEDKFGGSDYSLTKEQTEAINKVTRPQAQIDLYYQISGMPVLYFPSRKR